MKKWKKSSDALVASFDAAVPRAPEVERRQMFGYPCAFVRGQMFCGLHEENLIVRLGADGGELAALGGKVFEPMPGRRMKEYLVVPPDIVAKPRELSKWLAAGLAYATALSAKVAVKKAPRAKPAAKTAAAKRG